MDYPYAYGVTARCMKLRLTEFISSIDGKRLYNVWYLPDTPAYAKEPSKWVFWRPFNEENVARKFIEQEIESYKVSERVVEEFEVEKPEPCRSK